MEQIEVVSFHVYYFKNKQEAGVCVCVCVCALNKENRRAFQTFTIQTTTSDFISKIFLASVSLFLAPESLIGKHRKVGKEEKTQTRSIFFNLGF